MQKQALKKVIAGVILCLVVTFVVVKASDALEQSQKNEQDKT